MLASAELGYAHHSIAFSF